MPKDSHGILRNTLTSILFFFLFQFSCFIAFAQTDSLYLDSLVQSLKTKKGTEYVDQLIVIAKLQNTNLKKIELLEKALENAKSGNYTKALADINFKLGEYFGGEAILEKSIEHFDEAIRYAKLLDDKEFELEISCKKSYRLTMSGKTEEAFELLMEALRRAEHEVNSPKLRATIHFELGDFHRLQHDVEKAVFHLNKALEYYENQNNILQQAKLIFTIGNTYKIGRTEEFNQQGIACMEKLLEPPFVDELPSSIVPKVQTSLGGMLVYSGEFEKGEEILLSSLAVKEARKDTMSMVYSYNELATLYSDWGQPEKSILYGEKILDITKKRADIFSIYDSYRNLSEAYALIGNYEMAFRYSKETENLRDSIVNQEKAIALADMETKYKTDIQNEKLARQEFRMRQQRITTTWILGTILLFGLIAFLWFRARLKFKAKETKQLELLNESKTQFFTNISHELRTPLTLLVNPLRQIHTSSKPKEDHFSIPSSTIQRMLRNGDRLERLIKQMTNLSRLDEANYQLQIEAIDFIAFTKSIVDSFQEIAEEQNKELRFFSIEKSFMLYFDPEKMEDVLLNLLYNAFKFTEAEDTIHVLITSFEDKVQLQVQDSGIGIEEEKLKYVFDRFYQVNDRDTRAHEGMGIGLALVQQIVKLHQGEIQVESSFGKKTVFTLDFRLGKDHFKTEEIVAKKNWQAQRVELIGDYVLAPASDAVEEPKEDRALILVIEDNADLLDYLKEQLTTNYEVITASRAKEGLEKAFERNPELIISDLMMPEMDGFELCKILKSDIRTSHIPVILLTAKADSSAIKKGLKLGADDYIMKPFDQAILYAKIENLITQRRKLRVLFSEKLVVKPSDIKITSKEDQFLVDILKIVETHISDANFGVEELCKEIGFSRSQFYRKLKALTGKSPAVFMRTIRLDRAKQLLEQSAGNASEIAYMVGFNNPNYFFKCFKDQFGMTPKDVVEESTKIQEK